MVSYCANMEAQVLRYEAAPRRANRLLRDLGKMSRPQHGTSEIPVPATTILTKDEFIAWVAYAAALAVLASAPAATSSSAAVVAAPSGASGGGSGTGMQTEEADKEGGKTKRRRKCGQAAQALG